MDVYSTTPKVGRGLLRSSSNWSLSSSDGPSRGVSRCNSSRSVCFSDDEDVIEIPRLEKQERKKLFYRKEDYIRFKLLDQRRKEKENDFVTSKAMHRMIERQALSIESLLSEIDDLQLSFERQKERSLDLELE